MAALTNKDVKLLEYIQQYTDENACSPLFGEMAKHMNVSHPAIVVRVSTLEKKGVIRRRKRCKQSIEIVDPETLEKLRRKEEIRCAIVSNPTQTVNDASCQDSERI